MGKTLVSNPHSKSKPPIATGNAAATATAPAMATGSAAATATEPATPPDFGNAGKLTTRVDMAAVALHVSNGEYLDYALTVNAPSPVFGFACEHKTWLTSSNFPAPQEKYTWTHFQKTGEVDAPDDEYSVTVLFIGAPITYTLLVTKRDKDGNVIQTLKDLDISSTDPTDFTTSTLEAIVV